MTAMVVGILKPGRIIELLNQEVNNQTMEQFPLQLVGKGD